MVDGFGRKQVTLKAGPGLALNDKRSICTNYNYK
jgi:hypothetical protein